MMWIWFALAILLLVVELATTQFVSIWFSISALITGVVVAIFDEMGLIWQIVIFVVLAIGTLFATKPFVKRITGKPKDAKTNLELNIGKTAIVTETIDNIKETGAVKINGLVWTARSDDGSVIEQGEVVIFKQVSGNKAIVSINKEENK
ncbi:MAG: NfeD family protein [Ruminococcaceae bacterium]|nr:NfeD family protein [Oscillospiraceae bacterium]